MLERHLKKAMHDINKANRREHLSLSHNGTIKSYLLTLIRCRFRTEKVEVGPDPVVPIPKIRTEYGGVLTPGFGEEP